LRAGTGLATERLTLAHAVCIPTLEFVIWTILTIKAGASHKRGGARTLVATNKGNRWFFLFGFEKNDRANISAEEKEALQSIAQDLLARTGKDLDAQVEGGTLQEICNDH